MIPKSLHQTLTTPLPDQIAVSNVIKTIVKEEIIDRFQRLQKYEITTKSRGEIVTDADIQTEIRLSSALRTLMPSSTIIGEEGYEENNSVIERFDGDSPVWVIDPLDGTRNFSEGKPCFCTIVAFCLNNTTYLAWIYDPINKLMYFAAKGSGAWCNDKIIETKFEPEISEMTGSIGKNRREYLFARHSKINSVMPKRLTRYRCCGMEYVDLARGRLHFAEYNLLKPWDHAAGILIMEEAGGYGAFIDTNQPYTPGPIINNRFVATHRAGNWNFICKFLSDKSQ